MEPNDFNSETDVRKKTFKVNKNSVFYPVKVVSDGEETDTESLSPNVMSIIDAYDYGDSCSRRISRDGMMKAAPVQSSDLKEKLEEQTEGEAPLGSPGSYNLKALSKYATTYELEKFEKNILIIFNQVNVEGYSKPRFGTEKDVEALTSTFGNFGFDHFVHSDLTKEELFRELKSFSEMDFTDYGCVVIAVLTHGTKNGLLRAKDQLYSEIEIINHFKVNDKPTLVTKPRILIIQACRGTRDIQGVPVFQGGRVQRDLEEEVEVEPYYLPVESDMLVIHSSYIGNPSHRDEALGSWFIQSLCNKIKQLASTHDLESIVTEVKREVAIDKYHEQYNRRTFEIDVNKQMPVLTSTLIRKLYLRRFGEQTKNEFKSNVVNTSSGVLDGVPSNLQLQFGSCSCFLDHFNYIRNCLRYFLEDNPEDVTAKAFLSVADTFEDGVEFNTSKEEMLKAICNHLYNNFENTDYYKYLHFYKS